MTMTPHGGTARPRTEPERPDSGLLLARMHELHPKLIDLSLDRIEQLLDTLGNPHLALPPVIHVAGTNGKGSVVAFLKAMLEAAGHRVHAFISPHLISFHERIVLAAPEGGRPISEDALVDVLQRAEIANQGSSITFFEITTAAAFLAFSESPADFLILETGLGGRLDATNVVPQPALTVLTSISIDHTSFLGETLAEIADEKAGILKPGVPCVVARQDPIALARIEKRAEEVDAPLISAGRDWDAYEQHGRLIYQTTTALVDLPLPRLAGRHQIDNAGAAISVIRALFRDPRVARALEVGLTTAT
ncbi:MAG: bifunctional folylpolyglutamate synthase/dihydrofolate synthase, partial [Methyloligellaceae bacterium]